MVRRPVDGPRAIRSTAAPQHILPIPQDVEALTRRKGIRVLPDLGARGGFRKWGLRTMLIGARQAPRWR
jgi:hypothetical protein